MRKITPFLWFDGRAEEAVNFYVSTFKKSKIISARRAEASSRLPKGTLVSATFRLEGQDFIALNGGPMFSFSPAISFFVDCRTQGEVDALWERLSEGGSKQQCGWLKDKFGVSWQVIPKTLTKLLHDPDPRKAAAVMKAMLQMTRINIKELQQAYAAA